MRFTPTRVGTLCTSRSPARRRAVHPHTRGDTMLDPYRQMNRGGSPPHAWGHFTASPLASIFPAVHPHTRGDTVSTKPIPRKCSGSPPHAWGHFIGAIITHGDARFTPTRVGTLGTTSTDSTSTPVHPHTRGDTRDKLPVEPANIGSPPHAWGHSGRECVPGPGDRFTPTRVGTLAEFSPPASPPSVHPHTRGDTWHPNVRRRGRRGSPPHAWGHFNTP